MTTSPKLNVKRRFLHARRVRVTEAATVITANAILSPYTYAPVLGPHTTSVSNCQR